MPNPIDNEDLYDAIKLAGVRSPGTCKISGAARVEKWDVKEGAGVGGAATTRKGEEPATFSVAFYLVKDEIQGLNEYAEWDLFLPVLKSSTASSTTVKALLIEHPDLAELDITKVVVTKIGQKVHDGKGGATVTVEFLEYRPPKPKTGTAQGGWTTNQKKNDPNADVKTQLDAVLAEAKKVPA